MNYAVAGQTGLEQNFRQSSNPTLQGNVGFVASVLHDLFDGHGDLPQPSDGTHWSDNGTRLFWDGGLEDSDRSDEAVRMVGPAVKRLLQHVDERGQSLSFDNFLGGLEELAIEEGFSGFEVCGAFALHFPSGQCPNYSGMDTRPRVTDTKGTRVRRRVFRIL